MSESAYRAGLIFEAMLEANLFGLKAPALDRIPGARGAKDAAINRMLDRAQSAVAFEKLAKRVCGESGHAVLCATLARGRSFGDIAVGAGMGRVRGGRKIAAEFRTALEALGRELGG